MVIISISIVYLSLFGIYVCKKNNHGTQSVAISIIICKTPCKNAPMKLQLCGYLTVPIFGLGLSFINTIHFFYLFFFPLSNFVIFYCCPMGT